MITIFKKIILSWRNDLIVIGSRDVIPFFLVIAKRYKTLITHYLWLTLLCVFFIATSLVFYFDHVYFVPTFFGIWTIISFALGTLMVVRPSVNIKNMQYLYASSTALKMALTNLFLSGIITLFCTHFMVVPVFNTASSLLPSYATIGVLCILTNILAFITLWISDSSFSFLNFIRSITRTLHMLFLHLPLIITLNVLEFLLFLLTAYTLSSFMLPLKFMVLIGVYISVHLTIISTLYIRFLYQEMDSYYGITYQDHPVR